MGISGGTHAHWSDWQSVNAPLEIVETVSGITTDTNVWQPSKAPSAIELTLFGMTTLPLESGVNWQYACTRPTKMVPTMATVTKARLHIECGGSMFLRRAKF